MEGMRQRDGDLRPDDRPWDRIGDDQTWFHNTVDDGPFFFGPGQDFVKMLERQSQGPATNGKSDSALRILGAC
jgi:hypothetical protein